MTMYLSFAFLFEEQARRETRDVTFTGYPDIPDDSYGLLEYYCPDPECDCQMVLLQALSKRLQQPVASLVYSFRPTDPQPGRPNPDLGLTSQASYAPALLEWLGLHLQEDPAYEQRLRHHYQQVKEAAANPAHPAHAKYLAWQASQEAESNPSDAKEETPQHKARRKPATHKQAPSVPKAMLTHYEEIVALADHFCREKLNEEYRELCHKMAAALARKRPSPLSGGKTSVWACAILYALGQVNFLFDKSQQPYVSTDELCNAFGVSKSTAGNKARQIREALNIYVLDPKWSLLSRLNENPMAWMISVNGFIMDARTAPREVQEEAYRKGLIPYIPGDET